MEELERVLARKKMEENIKIKEREREAALIRQLKMKQELEAPLRNLNPTQNFFSGKARTKPNPAPEVDIANLLAQQLKMTPAALKGIASLPRAFLQVLDLYFLQCHEAH